MKTTKNEDDPKNENDQKLGGKPFVHSYVVILMLLGLFPEKFRDFSDYFS